MLKFDSGIMYIIDMGNGKNTYNFKIKMSDDFVRCHLIPFVLFWSGILSPVVTDESVVIICALVPFYGYLYSLYVSRGKKTQAISSVLWSFFTSLILFVPFAGLMVFFESFEVVAGMMVVNAFMSIILYFLARISYACETTFIFPFYVPPSD